MTGQVNTYCYLAVFITSEWPQISADCWKFFSVYEISVSPKQKLIVVCDQNHQNLTL